MPTKRVKRPSKRRSSPPVSRPGALRGLRIEVFEGKMSYSQETWDKNWYVRLRWPNGRIFATSEAYSSRAKAFEMARRAYLVGVAPGARERRRKVKR